jgi:hypothetical protein
LDNSTLTDSRFNKQEFQEEKKKGKKTSIRVYFIRIAVFIFVQKTFGNSFTPERRLLLICRAVKSFLFSCASTGHVVVVKMIGDRNSFPRSPRGVRKPTIRQFRLKRREKYIPTNVQEIFVAEPGICRDILAIKMEERCLRLCSTRIKEME